MIITNIGNTIGIENNKMIEKIENFLRKSQEQKTIIDISNLNLIDATKTAIICSTHLFTKYPDKKICWSVKDEETKKTISNLMLKNMELEIKKDATIKKVYALR